MDSHPDKKHILIIGGGVIGLQCADTLLSEGGNRYRVSLVAEYLPGDNPGIYASAWAGAQWRSHEKEFTEAAEWDVQTYRYWDELVQQGERCGVTLVKARNYWASLETSTDCVLADTLAKETKQTQDNPDPWWAKHVKSYQRIDRSMLPPDIAFGVTFGTFTVEVQAYLTCLRHRIEARGAAIARVRLPTDQGLEGAANSAIKALGLPMESKPWAIINATGMQARELIGDKSLYPIRGQTIQVRGVANYCTTRLGSEEKDRVAIMPRPSAGVTIIGVTVEPGVESVEVDQAKIPVLLSAAAKYCPELLDEKNEFDMLDVGVGIRPGRQGGARVELESTNDLTVVHAYGVAGAGYQNSIGLARKVLNLLDIHGLRSHRVFIE